jgi:hypothetical protein
MNKIFLRLLLASLVMPMMSHSQAFSKRWKAYRIEYDFGVGASNFLGELGGANQIGTHAFKDLELSQTRLALCAGLRYRLSQFIALHPHLTYGRVAGDDKLTTEFYRNYRNLNFRSDIFEFNTTIEFAVVKEQYGRRYHLGVFYFNPQGQYHGQWYDLQPLGTEGQGAIETRKKYARLQFCVPIGLGFKYAVDRHFGIGLEFGLRYTFTDYIDDVSKTYVEPSLLASNGGSIAVALADKSLIEQFGNKYKSITEAGAQRGDPRHNDSYMFAIFSVNYKLKTGRVNYPMF